MKMNLLPFAFAAAMFFVSCENTSTKTDDHAENMEESKEQVREENNDVFDAYIELKDALVQSDTAEARKEAGEMKVELDKVQTSDMQPADIEAWNAEANKIREHLDKIQQAKNLDEMRTHFSPLSEEMYASLKKFGIADETAYYQHCPMAFDNKGANWLSDKDEIRNPYFGDKMLKCGEVKEEIKAKE